MTATVTDATRGTFLRLLDEFEQPLRRLTSGYAASPADRDDLFQEIAIAVWGALPHFRGESSERTWIYRIAHNTALTWKSKRSRLASRELEDEQPETHSDRRPLADDRIADRQQRERLARVIRALPPPDRQLVMLYLEGLSAREIAEVSGLSENAAATRLSRIRAKLAERMQGKEGSR
jgi:RNA polymerase sigma-70 factor (ECF subfamily)